MVVADHSAEALHNAYSHTTARDGLVFEINNIAPTQATHSWVGGKLSLYPQKPIRGGHRIVIGECDDVSASSFNPVN
jgi:hypothetical protein